LFKGTLKKILKKIRLRHIMRIKYRTVTFRVKAELANELKNISMETGIAQSFLITKAITRIINELQEKQSK